MSATYPTWQPHNSQALVYIVLILHIGGMGTQVILVRVMGHRLFLKVHTKEMTIVQI